MVHGRTFASSRMANDCTNLSYGSAGFIVSCRERVEGESPRRSDQSERASGGRREGVASPLVPLLARGRERGGSGRQPFCSSATSGSLLFPPCAHSRSLSFYRVSLIFLVLARVRISELSRSSALYDRGGELVRGVSMSGASENPDM